MIFIYKLQKINTQVLLECRLNVADTIVFLMYFNLMINIQKYIDIKSTSPFWLTVAKYEQSYCTSVSRTLLKSREIGLNLCLYSLYFFGKCIYKLYQYILEIKVENIKKTGLETKPVKDFIYTPSVHF